MLNQICTLPSFATTLVSHRFTSAIEGRSLAESDAYNYSEGCLLPLGPIAGPLYSIIFSP
jgi:hypothetical protein